jgi:hypothetical protein
LEGDRVFVLPYASCLSTFQAPGWGTSAVFSLRRWRNATLRGLVPFSRCSASRIFIMQPGCTPPPAVTQDGDLQFDGGGKRARLRPLPLPQPQGFSSPGLGRGVCRVGVGPCVGSGPLLPSVIGGKGVRCLRHGQLQRARLSEPSGFGAAPGAAFCHGSWKRFRRRRACRRHPRTDLQLYGLLPVLASRVGGMGEGLLAAASALRSSLLLFGPHSRSLHRRRCWGERRRAVRRSSVAPQAPAVAWGCSYLRRWNRSSVCNGTLSAGVLFIAAVEA